MDEETAAMKLSFQESKLFFANRAKKSVASTYAPNSGKSIKENNKQPNQVIKCKAQLEPQVFDALTRSLEEIAENLSVDIIIEANSKFSAKKCLDQQFQMVLKKSIKDCATKMDSVQIKPRRFIKPNRSFGIEVKDSLRQSLLDICQSLSEEEIIAANRFFKFEGTFEPNLQEALRISLVGALSSQQSTPTIISSAEKVNPPHESCISYTPIASETTRGASDSPARNTIEHPEPLVQKFIDERLKRRQSQSPNESPIDVSRPERYDPHACKVDHSNPPVNHVSETLSVNERALLMNKNLSKSGDGKANVVKVNISNDHKSNTAMTNKPNNTQWIGGLAVVSSTVAKAISKIQESPKRENNKNYSQAVGVDAQSVPVAGTPILNAHTSEDNAARHSSYPQSRLSESHATVSKLVVPDNLVQGVESDSEDDLGTIISWDETCGIDPKLDKTVLQSLHRSRTSLNDATSDRRKRQSREFFDAPSFYDTMNSGSITTGTNARYDSTYNSPQDIVSNSSTLETPDSESSRPIPYVNPQTNTRNSEVTINTEIPSFQDIFQPIHSKTSTRLSVSNEDRSPSTSLEDRQRSATVTESSMAGTTKLFQHSSSSSTYRSSKCGSISKDDALKSALLILKKSLVNPVTQEDSIRSVVAMLEDVLLQSSLSSSLYSFISHDKGPEQSSQITQLVSTSIDFEHMPPKSSSSHDTDQGSNQKGRRFSRGNSHRRSEPALFDAEVLDDIKNNGLKRIDESLPAAPSSIHSKNSALSCSEMVFSATLLERTSAATSAVQGFSSNQRASQMLREDTVVAENSVRERQLSNASTPVYKIPTPSEGRNIFTPLEQLTSDHQNGIPPVTPKYSNSILNQSALHSRSVYVPGSSESVEQLLSYKSNASRTFEQKIYDSTDYYMKDHRNSFPYSASIQNNEQSFVSNQNISQESNFDWNARPFNRSQHREAVEKQNLNIDHVWRGQPNDSEYGVDMNITIDSFTSSPFRNLRSKQPLSPRLHGTKLPTESINLSRSSSFVNRESSSIMNNSQLPWDQSPRTRAFESLTSSLPGLQLQSSEGAFDEQYKLHQLPARSYSYNEEWYSRAGSSGRVVGVSHDQLSVNKVNVDFPETVNPLAMRSKVSSPNYSSYFDSHVQPFSSPRRSFQPQTQQPSLPPLPHHKYPTQSFSQSRQPSHTSIDQAGYYQTPPPQHQQQSELMYHDITIEQLSTTSSITDDSPSDYQSESIDEPLMPIEFPYQRSHPPLTYQQRESFFYNTTFRNYDKRSDSQDRFSRSSASGLDFGPKQIPRTDSRQQLSHPSGGMNAAVRMATGRWTCSTCTLINNANFLVCDVCGSVRDDLK